MDYTFPHSAHAPTWILSAPAEYNQKDLRLNLLNSHHKGELTNLLSCP
jgi:hypothetical protein